MSIAAALFDLDGTLVDREPLITAAVAQVMADIGASLDEGGAEAWVGRAWPDLHVGLDIESRTGVAFGSFMEHIATAAERLEGEGYAAAHLPGAVALIERLSAAGVPLAGVTGSMHGGADPGVTAPGGIEVLEAAEAYAPGQPHPACYLLAAGRLGVDPAGCVAFEDSEVGLASARAAGMWTIGVAAANPSPSHPAHQDLSGAHVVVESLVVVTETHLEPWSTADGLAS